MTNSLDIFIEKCNSMQIDDIRPYENILNILNNKNFDVPVIESNIDNTTRYPIFIVLMHSGTLLANTIKKVTKDDYSHACISFDPSLDPLYSFGRKKLDIRDTGFAINKPKDLFFTNFKTSYGIYVIYVSKYELDSMKLRLQYFINNSDKLKYSISGLLFNYAHLKNENQKKFFCSRFVADVLSAGGLVDKSPSLYRPNDFSTFPNIIKVDEGDDFYKYNKETVIQNLKKLEE